MQISPAQLINTDNYERVRHINLTPIIYTPTLSHTQAAKAATFVNTHVYANAPFVHVYFIIFMNEQQQCVPNDVILGAKSGGRTGHIRSPSTQEITDLHVGTGVRERYQRRTWRV